VGKRKHESGKLLVKLGSCKAVSDGERENQLIPHIFVLNQHQVFVTVWGRHFMKREIFLLQQVWVTCGPVNI